MRCVRGLFTATLIVSILALAVAPGAAAPEGQITWAVHVSLAPTWFDPAETAGIITPYMLLYALHDALVKPMPGNPTAPEPGRVVERLAGRARLRVHPAPGREVPQRRSRDRRGRQVLAGALPGCRSQDAEGTGGRGGNPRPRARAHPSQAAVAGLHDLLHGRHGAGWIVPRKYVEKVGDDGFKKAPVGAGPYRFVSFTPGVELVLEAFEQYWRKPPSVKRLVFKAIPDESTRLAALKRGEVDIAYAVRGELAEQLRRTPGLTLRPTWGRRPSGSYFTDQWDPKSPWHDRRVRLASNLAIDRQASIRPSRWGLPGSRGASFPGASSITGSRPPTPTIRPRPGSSSPRPGTRTASTRGTTPSTPRSPTSPSRCVNDLRQVGIKAQLRPLERAAFFKGYAEKKYKGLIQGGQRRLRQCGHPHRGLRGVGRHVCLRKLSRHRRALPGAGERAGPQAAGGARCSGSSSSSTTRCSVAPIWRAPVLNGVGPQV